MTPDSGHCHRQKDGYSPSKKNIYTGGRGRRDDETSEEEYTAPQRMEWWAAPLSVTASLLSETLLAERDHSSRPEENRPRNTETPLQKQVQAMFIRFAWRKEWIKRGWARRQSRMDVLYTHTHEHTNTQIHSPAILDTHFLDTLRGLGFTLFHVGRGWRTADGIATVSPIAPAGPSIAVGLRGPKRGLRGANSRRSRAGADEVVDRRRRYRAGGLELWETEQTGGGKRGCSGRVARSSALTTNNRKRPIQRSLLCI